MTTEKRKQEHVEIVLKEDVESLASAGWESVRFKHYALPEMDLREADTSTTFLGRKLKAPFLVSSMTGGCPEAEEINKDLAAACEKEGVMMALGSQRAMIEDKKLARTFQVKDAAPKLFLAGNIGGFQLKEYGARKVVEALQAVGADAVFVHLNPLQEAVQNGGDTDWRGVLKAIAALCEESPVPVIAKEVGSGISGVVAKELEQAGVKAIDVAGLGGTSWSAVEKYRGSESGDVFRDWGISSAIALNECVSSVKIPVIASGGIRSGLECAKAIRLGAALCGAASPFLKAQQEGGTEGVQNELQKWKRELQTAMFLTRSKSLKDLRKAELVE